MELVTRDMLAYTSCTRRSRSTAFWRAALAREAWAVAVWAKLGSKRRLWERMRALFYDYALESMRQLLEALLYGVRKPKPILAVDAS